MNREIAVRDLLTHDGAIAFAQAYRGPRSGKVSRDTQVAAHTALRAWYHALRTLGRAPWLWQVPTQTPPLDPLLQEYRTYRLEQCGVSLSTLPRDLNVASIFVSIFRARNKNSSRVRVANIDEFILTMSKKWSRQTLADACSSLRAFLRFLHVNGHVVNDVAALVISPRVLRDEKPPRAIAWPDVRKILGAVELHRRGGRRDYAILLLMATYGVASAEVLGLRTQDIDWRKQEIHFYRPKTRVAVDLPLLPSVARALSAYLRHERPRHLASDTVFVSLQIPHLPLSGSAIRNFIRVHASKAGVVASVLGGHLFRHSHASRQVDIGVNPKVLSDILGHRDPSSTSRYVRVAFRRLREVALEVPR